MIWIFLVLIVAAALIGLYVVNDFELTSIDEEDLL